MSSNAIETPLPPNLFARLAQAARYAISGVSPDTWFGPQQPLAPQAPPEVKGRQWDYPFGVNLSYVPRASGGISFAELRALADALPLLRAVIETRKDQIAGLSYAVRARDPAGASDAQARIGGALAFLARPDRRHSFSAWLRMLLEDMLVIDAATIHPRFDRGGDLYSLDVVDGSTITPLIGEDGRSPDPPDPAYQQILHGVPAADFSSDELLYLPISRAICERTASTASAPSSRSPSPSTSRSGATRRRSTTIAQARRPTPSPRCPRNGRSIRSGSSRIISTL